MRAAADDPGEHHAAHVDRELRARLDQHVGGERAVIGAAARGDGIGAATADDAGVEIDEADADAWPRCAQHDDGRGRAAGDAGGQRAVCGRIRVGIHQHRAGGRIEPAFAAA